jgi:aspartate/methionine/tyrosine aminotransferase
MLHLHAPTLCVALSLLFVLCTLLQERDAVLGSLARRAATLVAGLNQLEGVSCNAAEGALYAFPRYADPVV